jgi:ankyrin repeat protein
MAHQQWRNLVAAMGIGSLARFSAVRGGVYNSLKRIDFLSRFRVCLRIGDTVSHPGASTFQSFANRAERGDIVRIFKRSILAAVAMLTLAGTGAAALAQSTKQLIAAVQEGDVSGVKYQIAQGVNVNDQDAGALYRAASAGHLEIVKILVQAGGDVNLDPIYGNRGSAIRIAAKNKQYKVVDYLLSVGADLTIGGEHRGSTLTAAVMTGKLDLVKKVVAGGKANLDFKESLMRLNDGKTALMIAATRDFSDIVQYLGAQGAKINVARACGETALYYAAKRGSVRVVQYLLSKGAVVNPATTENCNDPSPILVAQGMEVHRLLLLAGANPNMDPKSVDYWARPIARAATACDHKLVDLLILHNAVFDAELKQEYAANCKKAS